jgi:hypothetical protein
VSTRPITANPDRVRSGIFMANLSSGERTEAPH